MIAALCILSLFVFVAIFAACAFVPARPQDLIDAEENDK